MKKLLVVAVVFALAAPALANFWKCVVCAGLLITKVLACSSIARRFFLIHPDNY